MLLTPENIENLKIDTIIEWNAGPKKFQAIKIKKDTWRRIILGETFTDEAALRGGPTTIKE